MIVFGFDPGGVKNFGWASARFDLSGGLIQLATGVVFTAPDAVNAALYAIGEGPAAIGIDSPLFSVEAGDRQADRHIRKRVIAAGGSSGTVSSVNSFMGACLS